MDNNVEEDHDDRFSSCIFRRWHMYRAIAKGVLPKWATNPNVRENILKGKVFPSTATWTSNCGRFFIETCELQFGRKTETCFMATPSKKVKTYDDWFGQPKHLPAFHYPTNVHTTDVEIERLVDVFESSVLQAKTGGSRFFVIVEWKNPGIKRYGKSNMGICPHEIIDLATLYTMIKSDILDKFVAKAGKFYPAFLVECLALGVFKPGDSFIL